MASFTNQATLSYSGGTTMSNIVTGEVVATFSATKTAVTGQYAPGDTVTYVVSILNTSDSPLTALTVSDDLGGYEFQDDTLYPLTYAEGSMLCYLDGVLQAQPAVTAGPPMEVTGITIPAGSNAMLIYETTATEYAPLGTGASVTNTAVISCEGMACQTEASSTVPAGSQAQLTVSKSLSPEEIPAGAEDGMRLSAAETGGEAGLFLSGADGLEGLSPEDADALTPAGLDALLALKAEREEDAGRLVLDFACCCAAFC